MPQMECITCGDSFFRRGEPRKRPFCSKECRKKSKERSCEQCGDIFLINGPSDPQLYCSPKCGTDSRKHSRPMAQCAFCGNDVGRPVRVNTKRSFCSAKCQADYHHPPKTKLCKTCLGKKGNCDCTSLRGTEWGRMISRERGNSKAKFNRHYQMVSNPWLRKIDAVMSSIRSRRTVFNKSRSKLVRCSNWEEGIELARRKAKSWWRRQIKKEQDPWWLKVQTVESNWRKKTNAAKGNKQSVV